MNFLTYCFMKLLSISFSGVDFFIILFICFFIFIILLSLWKWKKISAQKKRMFAKTIHQLKKISSLPKTQQILEYDKILDKSLFILGYKGTTGKKMKDYGKKFFHQNNIWFAHKLRNKIAHEIAFTPSEKEFMKAKKSFMKEITKIIYK